MLRRGDHAGAIVPLVIEIRAIGDHRHVQLARDRLDLGV
jgi:hypothetical protein